MEDILGMRELIILEPVVKEKIWGTEYWTISAHKSGDCLIKGGRFDGMHLSKVWKEHREVFGINTAGDFPLLVKVIDTKEPLSVQVHPDNEYAGNNENGQFGKTECWYVMDCKKNTSIIVGHNAKSHEEAKQMIDEGRWDDFLKKRKVKKGDFFQITPGTIHSIMGGTKIMEIQQSSDLTYRLYDYDRLCDGQKRELHIDKCLDVIRVPHVDADTYSYGIKEKMVFCRYYDVDKCAIKDFRDFSNSDTFRMVSVIEGKGELDGNHITEGESFIIPANYGDFTIEGNLKVMITNCPRKYGALEAGGTKMVCAYGYADGTIVERVSIPTTTPEETIPKITEFFKNKDICALGVGSFGPVDVNPESPTFGTILDSPKLAWQHYPLREVLQNELKVPVNVDTDVNGSCLGEMTFGCAKGLDNVVYLTIGTGIGAGIAVSGKLVHGMVHPEAGHIMVERVKGDDYKGKCPFHDNCLEALAAGPAIEGRWGKKAENLSDKPEVWELEADYIAQGLMSLVMTVSPRKIILGGGVMHQTQLYPLIQKKLIEKINGYVKSKELADIENYVVPPSLDDNQGVLGALELAVLA